MKLSVNGNNIEQAGDSATVQEVLAAMHYSFPLVIIKVNDILIAREAYAKSRVKDGDVIDVFHLVSGG
jgi:thiamine biosynthesis protein ThiS